MDMGVVVGKVQVRLRLARAVAITEHHMAVCGKQGRAGRIADWRPAETGVIKGCHIPVGQGDVEVNG